MNTDTGRLYELRRDLLDETGRRRDVTAGDPALRSYVERFERIVGELTDDEAAAAQDLEAGATIVPVSDAVAQKVRLGERELERRVRRRRAAKQSRKRQRQ